MRVSVNLPPQLAGLVPHEVLFDARPRVRWGVPQHLPLDADYHGNRPTSDREHTAHERDVLTDLEALAELGSPALPGPSGLIFHTSHCGSTLLSSMLAAPGSILSLCAPKLLLDLHTLRMRGILTPERCVEYLAAAIRLFGAARTDAHAGYVLKFNTVHLPALPAIEAQFPDTPWLAMYREPVEIMSGQLSRPLIHPYWLLRDYYLQLPPEPRLDMGIAEGLARMLGRYYTLILEALRASGRGRCFNYAQSPEAALSGVLSHFELRVSESDLAAMRANSRIYSKDPRQQRVFQPDERTKRDGALPIVRSSAATWAQAPYEELEAHRQRTLADLATRHRDGSNPNGSGRMQQ